MKQMKVSIYILVTAFILSSCSIQKRCQAPELNLPDEIIAGDNHCRYVMVGALFRFDS